VYNFITAIGENQAIQNFARREMNNILYVVVPCYNEEMVLRGTADRLREKMKTLEAEGKISETGRIVFIDDGSRDSTWEIIKELSASDALFAGIKLSGNRGHQHALYAGLMTVRGEADMVISIDMMVDEYLGGCDIVYGVRKSRKNDSFLKRATAEGYYKLLRKHGCEIVYNHADFRLMSSRALEALSGYSEQRLFLRGLVPLLGYKTAVVYYDRSIREAGESKYNLIRMLSLAFDGLFSLSLRPLRAVMGLGAVMIILAAALLIYLVASLSAGRPIPDWMTVTASIWGVGGIITFSLGIVGEYVGRSFIEVKRRPRYFIDTTTGLGRVESGKLKVES
jgi:glycosyltransferase involved in cell wall biosynthesis